jgi:hypothetical protein
MKAKGTKAAQQPNRARFSGEGSVRAKTEMTPMTPMGISVGNSNLPNFHESSELQQATNESVSDLKANN